jgi:hypothetical protein
VPFVQRVGGQRRQVDLLAAREALLAAGQDQQRLDDPLLVLAGREDPLQRVAQGSGRGIGIGQRHLDGRALQRQRRAQFMRGVRDESPLGGERSLQPVEQVVEGVGELGQLVVRAGRGQPPVEVVGGDLPHGGGHRGERAQHPSGHHPAQHERRRPHRRQPERRADQQPPQVDRLGRGFRHGRGRRRRRCREPAPEGRWEWDGGRRRGAGQGRVRGEQVHQPDEQRPRHQEQPAVEQGQPEPDGAPRACHQIR